MRVPLRVLNDAGGIWIGLSQVLEALGAAGEELFVVLRVVRGDARVPLLAAAQQALQRTLAFLAQHVG